jgi:tetratricopeptide (TPR) repeat protein
MPYRLIICALSVTLLEPYVLVHSAASDYSGTIKSLNIADGISTESDISALKAVVQHDEKNTSNVSDANPKQHILLQRPPFLKHVSKEQIRSAIQIAEKRHKIAVQRALETYPVWERNEGTTSMETQTNICDIHLKELPLQSDSSNCLPDYGEVIPTTVYVTDPPILSREQCYDVIRNAEQFFEQSNSGKWTRQKSGQYEVCGFDIHQIPSVKEWFIRTAEERLLPLLQQTFRDFCGTSVTDLCIDNAYLFKYTPETGRRTDIHTDSGCLSFTIALSSPETDYEGGGTWFHGLPSQRKIPSDMSNDDKMIEAKNASLDRDNNVLSMDIGQITIRPGGVKHCGYAVTHGTRYIIGGFCIHRTRPEHVRMLLQPSTSAEASQEDVQQLQLFETAIVLNPGCTAAYNLLANHYIQNGNTVKAKEILDYCIQNVDPQSSEVAYTLASICVDQQLYDKALHYVSICLQVDPQDVEAIMMSAMIASNMGDTNREARCYQEIINIPDAKPSVKASAYCNLGVLHQGEELELEYYRQSLICQPKTFSAMYSLASALASRKRWKDSIELFRQAIEVLNSCPDKQSNETALNRHKALRSLYTATMQFMKDRQNSLTSTMSRDEMIQCFQDTMGEDNFKELQNQKS